MAVFRSLSRLPGRIVRQIARRNTSDIVALDTSTLTQAPDQRGWELTVVSADLGAVKVRSLIEGALPRRLCDEFITTVARGGLLYLLFKNGRLEHYNWVGLTEPHQAHFVAEESDAISWNSWLTNRSAPLSNTTRSILGTASWPKSSNAAGTRSSRRRKR